MQKDWLLYQSEINPDKPFIKDGDKIYSYKDLNDIVYDRACSLIDYGVKNKSNVLISLPNSLDFIEAYLACYKIGSTSVVINYNWKKMRFKILFQIYRLITLYVIGKIKIDLIN